jgi:glycosyltransferase involved in cell wall biosynthesis
MIAALELTDRVQLAGFQKNPFDQVARADLYVLTSRAEGFPNSLLEAMALGVPVIAADCPSGPREILAPSSDPTRKASTLEKAEYGLLIPSLTQRDLEPGAPLHVSEQVLADSIIEMIKDERLRAEYADLAQRRALEFTPERMISEWQALITEVASASSLTVTNQSDSGKVNR